MNAEYILKRAIMEEKGYFVIDDKFINKANNSSFLCSDISRMPMEQFKFIFND